MGRRISAAIVGIALAVLSAAHVAAQVLIQNQGSDTLLAVALDWAETYIKANPLVALAVTGGGSGSGITALIAGSVDLANASRDITEPERLQANKAGIIPVPHLVGHDALAVFVHRDNPLDTIAIPDLAAIYRRDGALLRWPQLGVTVPGCDGQKIAPIGRRRGSGSRAYFRETVLGAQGFKAEIPDVRDSEEVARRVAGDPCAIGYGGLGTLAPETKVLGIAREAHGPVVQPGIATAADRSYPIARPLYIYTSGPPQGAVKAYLEWILGDAGQCLVLKHGYAPVRPVACD